MREKKESPTFPTAKAAAEAVVRQLTAAGHRALFAGGCVRDMLRGVEPHDFDVATSATPDEVRRIFPRAIPVGAAFGVVLVVLPAPLSAVAAARVRRDPHSAQEEHSSPAAAAKEFEDGIELSPERLPDEVHDETSSCSIKAGEHEHAKSSRKPRRRFYRIETATFRGERGYSDGRRPDEVYFTDEQEDARRRDFTVNALFFDPLKNEVLDYVGGRDDLRAGLLRAVGRPRERFEEDHLRLLRAARFAAQLDFVVEPETLAAARALAPKVVGVSAERIREELERMLCGPRPHTALTWLRDMNLLAHVLPEVAAFEGVEQPPQFHPEGDVWAHVLKMLSLLPAAIGAGPTPPTLAWAVLLHDVGKPATMVRSPDRVRFSEHEKVGEELTQKILRRLRCDNRTIETVCALVYRHMTFKDVQRMRPASLKRFLRLDDFPQHLELHRLDCLGSHGKLQNYDYCRQKTAEFAQADLRPTPLLTGRDLTAAGFKPGPNFGRWLSEVEERQLDGTLRTKEEALAFVRALAANADKKAGQEPCERDSSA